MQDAIKATLNCEAPTDTETLHAVHAANAMGVRLMSLHGGAATPEELQAGWVVSPAILPHVQAYRTSDREELIVSVSAGRVRALLLTDDAYDWNQMPDEYRPKLAYCVEEIAGRAPEGVKYRSAAA